MQNLYEILQNPTADVLRLHSIEYFDRVIEKFPEDWINIIRYINDCYNYHSELLVEDKDWGRFLMERFEANDLPEELLDKIIEFESEEFAYCVNAFLAYQKEPLFNTYTAKQDLRLKMLTTMQRGLTTTDKKTANEMVSSLDIEIGDLLEKFRQGQKVFGNFKGYDQVKTARNRHKIDIGMFID